MKVDRLGRKLQPGECACTRRGVKYCYKPGVGVRFVGKC
jgi:hypothetical protein